MLRSSNDAGAGHFGGRRSCAFPPATGAVQSTSGTPSSAIRGGGASRAIHAGAPSRDMRPSRGRRPAGRSSDRRAFAGRSSANTSPSSISVSDSVLRLGSASLGPGGPSPGLSGRLRGGESNPDASELGERLNADTELTPGDPGNRPCDELPELDVEIGRRGGLRVRPKSGRSARTNSWRSGSSAAAYSASETDGTRAACVRRAGRVGSDRLRERAGWRPRRPRRGVPGREAGRGDHRSVPRSSGGGGGVQGVRGVRGGEWGTANRGREERRAGRRSIAGSGTCGRMGLAGRRLRGGDGRSCAASRAHGGDPGRSRTAGGGASVRAGELVDAGALAGLFSKLPVDARLRANSAGGSAPAMTALYDAAVQSTGTRGGGGARGSIATRVARRRGGESALVWLPCAAGKRAGGGRVYKLRQRTARGLQGSAPATVPWGVRAVHGADALTTEAPARNTRRGVRTPR